MNERRVIIGRLSWSHGLVFLGILAMISLCLWMALIHGYYRPQFEGRQFGLLYFAPILGPLAFFALAMRSRLRALVFGRGVGLEIRGDRLIYLARTLQSARLDEIREIRPGRTELFEDVPGALIVEMATGRKWEIPTLGFRTSVPKMIERLAAEGIAIGEPEPELPA